MSMGLCDCGLEEHIPSWDPLYGTRRPRIVTLCGSTRFTEYQGHDYWAQAAAAHLLAGVAVFSIGVDFKRASWPQDAKADADLLHLWKIRLSDAIFVINVGGYVGQSTRREVAYAHRLGKGVRWLEPPTTPYPIDEWDKELDTWAALRS